MFAVIEIISTIVKIDEDRRALENWCFRQGLAEEAAGFTPGSCDGSIKLNPNVLIVELPDKEAQ